MDPHNSCFGTNTRTRWIGGQKACLSGCPHVVSLPLISSKTSMTASERRAAVVGVERDRRTSPPRTCPPNHCRHQRPLVEGVTPPPVLGTQNQFVQILQKTIHQESGLGSHFMELLLMDVLRSQGCRFQPHFQRDPSTRLVRPSLAMRLHLTVLPSPPFEQLATTSNKESPR